MNHHDIERKHSGEDNNSPAVVPLRPPRSRADGRSLDELASVNEHEDPLRPEILVRPSIAEMTDEAEETLRRRPDLGIYCRGNLLVRVVRDQAEDLVWLTRPAGTPSIIAARFAWLREQLDRAALWLKKHRKPSMPPAEVVSTLIDRCEWRLRALEGITECPLFLPNGEVLAKPGYHADTGILYVPNKLDTSLIPVRPKLDDARRAVDVLKEPLIDFPFVTGADRSVVLAGILSLLARLAYRGPTPGFAYRSTTPGSGKSLLADVVAMIATGRVAPRMTTPRDDEESRKRIMALAVAGTQLVLIDNCVGSFGSKSLAAALTADTWSDRVLGLTEIREAPLRATWLITGNNLQFRGDLGRRIVPCDIDPRVEFPEDRTGFRYDPLLGHVKRHRGELVAAALTILRAFHEAGRPAHRKPAKGSYEAWDGLVRASLIWAGEPDPLETVERLRQEDDGDREAILAGVRALGEQFEGSSFKASDAIEVTRDDPLLREALCTFARCDDRRLDARRLGNALRAAAGRPVGGFLLRRAGGDSHAKVVEWRVEACG